MSPRDFAFRSETTQQCFLRLVLAAGASSIPVGAGGSPANVDDARIIENAKTGKDWPTNGLDYGVNRYSPLDQITTANVGKLGLGWTYALNSIRGVEATPIVVDGVMYVTHAVEHRPRDQRQDRRDHLDFQLPIAQRRGQSNCVATS